MHALTLKVRQQWQTATWSDLWWLAGCSLMFVMSKWAGKFFEGLPGHAGAFWIPALFLARATMRPGAATVTSLVGSSAWCLSGSSGSFNVAGYVAAGLVLDALEFDQERLKRLPFALIGGVLCHLAKFGYHLIPAALLGTHVTSVVKVGFAPVIGLYLLFGLLGGLIGWGLLKATRQDADSNRLLSSS